MKRFIALASFAAACHPTRPPAAPEPAGPSPALLPGPVTTFAPAPSAEPPALAVVDSGSLRIEVQGGTCDVLVDGRSLGTRAPQEVLLSRGLHQVRCLRLDGTGPSQRVRITDRAATVAFKLM